MLLWISVSAEPKSRKVNWSNARDITEKWHTNWRFANFEKAVIVLLCWSTGLSLFAALTDYL